MHLLILRHAIAIRRGTGNFPNDDRPLTEDGIRKMERAARGIAVIAPAIHVILTSPLRRARQTADIVEAALDGSPKIIATEALLPGMDRETQLRALAKFSGNQTIMIVGHEPDLGLLASHILGSSNSAVEFKKGSLCSLTVSRRGTHMNGVLNWHVTPRQLRLLGK
jgi:phosphohistidine phosphatase